MHTPFFVLGSLFFLSSLLMLLALFSRCSYVLVRVTNNNIEHNPHAEVDQGGEILHAPHLCLIYIEVIHILYTPTSLNVNCCTYHQGNFQFLGAFCLPDKSSLLTFEIVTQEEAPSDLEILFYDDEPSSFNNVRTVEVCVKCVVLLSLSHRVCLVVCVCVCVCVCVACLFSRSHEMLSLPTLQAIARPIQRYASM